MRVRPLTLLPLALAARAFADQVAGHLDQAADRWSEARELTAANQNAGVLGIDSRNEGLLLAYRGEPTDARAAGLAQIRESTAARPGPPSRHWPTHHRSRRHPGRPVRGRG